MNSRASQSRRAGDRDAILRAVKKLWSWGVLLFLVADGFVGWYWYYQRRDHSQDVPILNAAKRYGVEPALVKAVVWRESWFDPQARGRAGEIGLMQIREPAAREWAEAERLTGFDAQQLVDPATNTLAGTWYLAKLLKRYPQTDNPFAYALADYNAGRTHVLRWNKGAAATNSAAFLAQMDYPTTRKYVETVQQRFVKYKAVFPEK